MEIIAVAAVVGLVLYLHNKGAAAPSASSVPVSATAVPTTTAAQSGAMFPGVPILGAGRVSAGYQVQGAATIFQPAGPQPVSPIPLPSIPTYQLPPPPPGRQIGGLPGPGTGGRFLGGVLRTGVSPGTGTTQPPLGLLQVVPRTLVL